MENKELMLALAQAQGEFPPIVKNQEVEVKKDGRLLYKFKFADLSEIIYKIRPVLSKHGLSFTQSISQQDGIGLCYTTRIMHSSGHDLVTGIIPIVINDNYGMKEIAGVSTYGKRLSLSAAFGICADDDMDAPQDKDTSIDRKEIMDHLVKSFSKPEAIKIPNLAPQAGFGEKMSDTPPDIPEFPPNSAYEEFANIGAAIGPDFGENEAMVTIRANCSYEDRAKPKLAGFRWNASKKIWTKALAMAEYKSTKFDFPVELL
jgi:hypothetical protein